MYLRPYCPVLLFYCLVLCAVVQEHIAVDVDDDDDDDNNDDGDICNCASLARRPHILTRSDPTRRWTSPMPNSVKT